MWARSCIRVLTSSSTRLHSRPTFRANVPVTSAIQSRYFRVSSLFLQEKQAVVNDVSQENLYAGHSRFIAEAERGEKWAHGVGNAQKGGEEGTGEEVEDIPEGKGRLSPTSSHLFKLIIPVPAASAKAPPPTVFLLHPSQPLSHVSRLILASLPPDISPATSISFLSIPHEPKSREIQWSDSTDIGDFVKEAAQNREFAIAVSPNPAKGEDEARIHVMVPSFRSRTRYLRHRLQTVSNELSKLEKVKRDCDHIAHRSARRLALGGFAMLLVYFGAVARLTFWDYGWDIMEPVTYLSGLTWIICGYLWFLYQGREVSYSSLLKQSVSTRRARLYESNGLDLDLWADLVTEEKQLKREIHKIADDYNIKWDGSPEGKFEVRTSGKTENPTNGTPSKELSRGTDEKDQDLTPEERAKKLKKLDEKAEIERDGDGKSQKEK
ncbi:transmembrane protein, putative [Rhizoctonia solani AG-3 Rhs1AP]|uniref:Calcium uniporter protein, mitochondrial n=1 Tax=Rhizoctonia solani AG-3 Rhs1AP TaxID=1086054 RepID=X8JHT7_9AGAM|nr:transmembrane protein, putative [Rhizoctonia solani AG-3 Rhs1AP]